MSNFFSRAKQIVKKPTMSKMHMPSIAGKKQLARGVVVAVVALAMMTPLAGCFASGGEKFRPDTGITSNQRPYTAPQRSGSSTYVSNAQAIADLKTYMLYSYRPGISYVYVRGSGGTFEKANGNGTVKCGEITQVIGGRYGGSKRVSCVDRQNNVRNDLIHFGKGWEESNLK